jgi:hypothetical protein
MSCVVSSRVPAVARELLAQEDPQAFLAQHVEADRRLVEDEQFVRGRPRRRTTTRSCRRR